MKSQGLIFAIGVALLMLMTARLFGQSEQRRLALVIGNGNYTNAPRLRNPPNDAKAMTAELEKLNFKVISVINGSYRQMVTAENQFADELNRYDVGLFYYSGHGVQYQGENYLVPVDANIQRAVDIQFEAVDASKVLADMGSSGDHVNIVILDACRDNPFAGQFRSMTRGLAVVQAPAGSLIVYSTAPDQVAADGNGTHSPFTQALLAHIGEKGVSADQMLTAVRRQVVEETGGLQVPWTSSSLTASFYFNGRRSGVPSSSVQSAQPAGGSNYGDVQVVSKEAGMLFVDNMWRQHIAAGGSMWLTDISKGSHSIEMVYDNGAKETKKITILSNAPESLIFNGSSVPNLIASTRLMNVTMQNNEQVYQIISNKDGSAFSVVTDVKSGILQQSMRYFVWQGTKKLGPFIEFEKRENGAWVAQDESHQWYVGSPSSVAGPLPTNSYPMWVHNMADRRLVFMADVSNGGFLEKGLPDASLFDDVWDITPSPANTEVAYVGQKGNNVFVAVGDQVNGPFDTVNLLRWSPDGSVCAYVVQVNGESYVYLGSKKYGPYMSVGDLVYAPDRKTLVYTADNYIIAGTEKLGPFRRTPSNLVFAHGGDRFAFTVAESGGSVVHLNDGTTYGPFDWGIRYSFSPDGKVFFCSGHDARTNKMVVYFGGKRTVINDRFTIANPLFSKDGKYRAFVFDTGLRSWEMDFGGKKLNIDATLPHGLLSDGTPLYWTDQNGEYYIFAGSGTRGPYEAVTNVSSSSKFRFLASENGDVYLLSCPR